MPPRKKIVRNSGPTPLSQKQQALAEQEARLQEEIRRREQFLKEAPKRMEEEQRKRRDEILHRASQATRRFDSRAALVDRRYDVQVGAVGRRRKSLKTEQHAARLRFLVLCVVAIGLAFWLYTLLMR
jgi:polyhydroxyalkanoate synthesis regulator protein